MKNDEIIQALINWLNSKGISYTDQLTEEELIELQKMKTNIDNYNNMILMTILENKDFSDKYKELCNLMDIENKKFEGYRKLLNEKYHMSLH